MKMDDLKGAYLACDRASLVQRLGASDIMRCSVIYEALKQRAFDGDFERFLAWSRLQSIRRPTHERPPPD